YGDLPFQMLISDLKSTGTSRQPFSPQVAFTFEVKAFKPGVIALDIENNTSKFDLHLNVVEGPNGAVSRFEYNPAAFDDDTVKSLGRRYEDLLRRIAINPN